MAEDEAVTATGEGEAPLFKKPRRNQNIRKVRGAADVAVATAADAPGGPGVSIEVMRELQKQRHRTKGVSLDPKAGQEAEDQTGAEADEHGLDSTFTAQTDAGEVDPNMLKYIEEQMKKEEEANGGSTSMTADDEDGLYTTPAHLQGRLQVAGDATGELEDANRWLAGIVEVPLSAEDKIAAVEETDKAKRRLMAQKLAPKAKSTAQMSMPANFNSNFHMHRRETAILRKGSGTGGAAGAGMRRGAAPPIPSDHQAVQAFRRNARDKHHR